MTAVKLSDQRGTGGGRSDRRCTISAVKDEGMGANGQPAYIQVSTFVRICEMRYCNFFESIQYIQSP